MKLIVLSAHPTPFFDGWNTKGKKYTLNCPCCNELLSIYVDDIQKRAWTWKSDYNEILLKEMGETFNFDPSNKSIIDGMKTVVEICCPKCKRTNYVYFIIDEYANSCYRITFNGLAIEN